MMARRKLLNVIVVNNVIVVSVFMFMKKISVVKNACINIKVEEDIKREKPKKNIKYQEIRIDYGSS